jgi:hypothetical protein
MRIGRSGFIADVFDHNVHGGSLNEHEGARSRKRIFPQVVYPAQGVNLYVE